VAQRAAAFVRKIDKLPLPVKDAPGFLVNAVLGPYMNEAMKCVDEGVAPEAIDAAWWPSACPWARSNWPTPSALTSPCMPASNWW
jgi:3-hydroxyacyl-CoA dehydrogenase